MLNRSTLMFFISDHVSGFKGEWLLWNLVLSKRINQVCVELIAATYEQFVILKTGSL